MPRPLARIPAAAAKEGRLPGVQAPAHGKERLDR